MYIFSQIDVPPNLNNMSSNKNECVTFKYANHQSKIIPETCGTYATG